MVPIASYFAALVFGIVVTYGETQFCDSNVKNHALRFINLAKDQLTRATPYPEHAGKNLAKGKTTRQISTTHKGASGRAVDGKWLPVYKAKSCTHTARVKDPYWYVNLGQEFEITSVWIQNRGDCCQNRLNNMVILVGNDVTKTMDKCASQTSPIGKGEVATFNCKRGTRGRYVKIQLLTTEILTLCEVAVFGYPAP